MQSTPREEPTNILNDKDYFTIHYDDPNRLKQFLDTWKEIQKLKFKGVHPLIGNEFERLRIHVDFLSEEKIRKIFEDIITHNQITKGAWPLASISQSSSASTILKEEVHLIEAVYPTLYFKSCNARGEFFGKLMYWDTLGKSLKRKFFNVFSNEHKTYKQKFQQGLTEIVGRLKLKQLEPQQTASA